MADKSGVYIHLIDTANLSNLFVECNDNVIGVYSHRSVSNGAEIYNFHKTIKRKYNFATKRTVQIAYERHILEPVLAYMNHSCDPNVYLDTENMVVVALRPINEAEEIRFFYPSTEWDMATPFKCYCGYKECLGIIKGAKHLDKNEYKVYRYVMNKHILDRYMAQNG